MAASDYVPIFFKNRLRLAGRPQMSTRLGKHRRYRRGVENHPTFIFVTKLCQLFRHFTERSLMPLRRSTPQPSYFAH